MIRTPASVGGATVENLIEIPAEYDPAKKWELRVQLHGGVGREPQEGRQPQSLRIPGESQIYIEPQASEEAAWWHTSQVDNILSLLDTVKRKYNIDESRIYVTGISDGGTGVYFLAMREPNAWSACLPLNGHPLVLANRDARIQGNLYLGNLVNCPLYIVNGDHDPLYPRRSLRRSSTPCAVPGCRRYSASRRMRGMTRAGGRRSVRPYEVRPRSSARLRIRSSLVGNRCTDRFNRPDG